MKWGDKIGLMEALPMLTAPFKYNEEKDIAVIKLKKSVSYTIRKVEEDEDLVFMVQPDEEIVGLAIYNAKTFLEKPWIQEIMKNIPTFGKKMILKKLEGRGLKLSPEQKQKFFGEKDDSSTDETVKNQS